MRNNHYLFLVEGECETHLIKVLKAQKDLIVSGKIQRKNVVQERISDMLLRTLDENTIAILVFDTDTNNVSILEENIRVLKKSQRIQDIWLVMQVENLEDELIRSTTIKKITELLGSKSTSEFKHEFIKEPNLYEKLISKGFCLEKMWVTQPKGAFSKFSNQGLLIKL